MTCNDGARQSQRSTKPGKSLERSSKGLAVPSIKMLYGEKLLWLVCISLKETYDAHFQIHHFILGKSL